MEYNDLPMIGEPTLEELQLTHYLMNGLAHYVSINKVDRRVLIAALSEICKIVFTKQTPFNVKEQCKEIDNFCNWIKSHALKDAVRS